MDFINRRRCALDLDLLSPHTSNVYPLKRNNYYDIYTQIYDNIIYWYVEINDYKYLLDLNLINTYFLTIQQERKKKIQKLFNSCV